MFMAKKEKTLFEQLQKEYTSTCRSYKRYSSKKKAMNNFLSHLKASKHTELSQISRQEIKQYDMEWINFLETAVQSVGAIVESPKRNLKTTRNVVPVELAKRVSSESIVHLAQNSQFIKNIDKHGNVQPDKILTIQAEDDYAIYENRFIKTLIDKLILFCQKRYEFMKEHAETKDYDILTVKSKVVIDGTTFEYESKIKISQPSQDEGKREYNEELFKKITSLVERVNFFKTTPFYQLIKDAKPVKNPIVQTNIMLKNINYKACYEVWKFLDRYDKLGLSIKIKEQQGKFDDAYIDELLMMTMMSELTMKTDRLHKLAIAESSRSRVQPKLNKVILDPSLDNTKFDIALTYGRDQMTPAQLRAYKKKEAQEKARLKREKEREAQRLKEKARREKEKEKRRLALLKQREKEKERKRLEAERKRLKKLEQERIAREKEKERKRLEAEHKRYLLEQEKLRRTRIVVKKAANETKEFKDLDIVTDDIISQDDKFVIKKQEKNVNEED